MSLSITVRLTSCTLLLLALFFTSNAHAYATINVKNYTGKTVIEAGDKVEVWIQHSLDEEFSEVRFGTATMDIYTGGWNALPFITRMNSSDGQKYDVWLDFTVPDNFSSNDTAFRFSARMRKNGTTYTLTGHQWIAVRGIPKNVTPKDDASEDGDINFMWNRVLGASRYHLEVVRFLDRSDPKSSHTAAAEIALDTLLPTNTLAMSFQRSGKYSWVVRAEVDGSWGSWAPASTFTILPMGVSEEEDASSVRLFPQPATNVVMIQSNSGLVRSAEIYDVSGKRMLGFMGSVNSLTELDISRVAPGVYQVKLDLGDRVIVKSLVKQ